MNYPIECNHVWKKYTKGEKITALRDAIPLLCKNLFQTHHTDKDQLNAQEFWVLKDVNFHVKKGEVLGIIGPNGAGKSTILKLLSKIIKPTKGDFHVRGRLSALIEITAGFHPDFTGRENVYFNAAILGMTKKEIDQKFNDIVEFSGVEDFIDTPVKRYSSGMYARLGFAVAAHVDPEVLLVDEVLAVGDMTFQAKCAQKMRDLLKSGTTIILVAHNIPLIQSICNRVILLNYGQILKEGTPEDVIPHYENLVSAKKVDELKQKLDREAKHAKDGASAQVEMTDVLINDHHSGQEKHFKSEDVFNVEIRLNSKINIDKVICSVLVIRGDGVVCCSANSKESAVPISVKEGENTLRVNLGHLWLSPGVYHLTIGIFDYEMIHAYAVRKKDFFRTHSSKLLLTPEAVFIPHAHWQAPHS